MAGVTATPFRKGRYRGYYRDRLGKRRFFLGTRGQSETRRMAARLEDDERQIALGYRSAPTSADTHRGDTWTDATAAYLKWGRRAGGRNGRPWAASHAKRRKTYLAWWGEKLRLEALGDLDTEVLGRAQEAMGELRAAGRQERTLSAYRESLVAFCWWLEREGRIHENPLRRWRDYDKRPATRRRALNADEIERLLNAAPPHRRLVYETALCSGLRGSELRALTAGDLDGERGGLILRREWTKNRRDGFQPLPAPLLERLAHVAKDKSPNARLLRVTTHPGRYFDEDRKAAGIEGSTLAGRANFHCLRVTYTSAVLTAGASVKEAQSLARHATPQLTMNLYGRTEDARLSKIAEAVGQSVLPEPESVHTVVHRQAAGAEGARHIPFDKKALQRDREEKGRWFKSTRPDQIEEAQDPDKSCASSMQTLAASDTCGPRQDPAPNRTPTPSEQPKNASLRKKCAHPCAPPPLPHTANGVPPDLAHIMDAWLELPEHIRAAVLALVTAAPSARGGDS